MGSTRASSKVSPPEGSAHAAPKRSKSAKRTPQAEEPAPPKAAAKPAKTASRSPKASRSTKASRSPKAAAPKAAAKPEVAATSQPGGKSPRRPKAESETSAPPASGRGGAKADARRSPKRRGRKDVDEPTDPPAPLDAIRVRRMHRRDVNRVWEFLKMVFRAVNRETVEYQRPRSKVRFEEQYDDDDVAQLIFEIGTEIVGYAECAYEVTGNDNWINPRYFDKRDMRPLFVEELASHPDHHGKGIGSFMLEQLQHLARVRGCTHLVLEVAENNRLALGFYRKRNFYKLDASIFLAQKVDVEPELLPPRALPREHGG